MPYTFTLVANYLHILAQLEAIFESNHISVNFDLKASIQEAAVQLWTPRYSNTKQSK